MEELDTQPENTPPDTPEEAPQSQVDSGPEPERVGLEHEGLPHEDQEQVGEDEPTPAPQQTISIDEWMASSEPGVVEPAPAEGLEDAQLMAVLEACVYVAEEPVTVAQLAAALHQDAARIGALVQQLMAEFEKPEHGLSIKEIAGGYKMATKAEHHEAVRSFVKSLKPPLKLSLPALETLAVIAYKQPVTTPEIMDIRGVQGGSVIKTLLDRKLIVEAGRKNVIGKPILFKTTKEFLIQFGLKDLSELPSLKEFEEIRRMSMSDSEAPVAEAPAEEASTEKAPEAEAPTAEVPMTEAPVAEVPVEEAPVGEAPVAEAPAEDPAPAPVESQEQ